jgi:hypothetical protein
MATAMSVGTLEKLLTTVTDYARKPECCVRNAQTHLFYIPVLII